jgi:hypothetical protein
MATGRITSLRYVTARPLDPIEATMRGVGGLPPEVLSAATINGRAFPQPRSHLEVEAHRATRVNKQQVGPPLVFRRPRARPIVTASGPTDDSPQSSGWFDTVLSRIRKSCEYVPQR